MRTAILIDSGCDVSQELVQRYHMKVMHLHIIYPERDYIDGVDILPETIYQRFPGEIPATSTPSPQDVKDMVEEIKAEGYTHVLAFWGMKKTLLPLCWTPGVSPLEPVSWPCGLPCSWKKAEVLMN